MNMKKKVFLAVLVIFTAGLILTNCQDPLTVEESMVTTEDALRAKWQNLTEDSGASPGVVVTKASITRNNFWRRVYFTLEVRYSANDVWHTLVGEQKLANNETYSKTLPNVYQARFLVRTKKSSAYSVTFEYLYLC